MIIKQITDEAKDATTIFSVFVLPPKTAQAAPKVDAAAIPVVKGLLDYFWSKPA